MPETLFVILSLVKIKSTLKWTYFNLNIKIMEEKNILLIGQDSKGNLILIQRPEDGSSFMEKTMKLDEEDQVLLKNYLSTIKTKSNE